MTTGRLDMDKLVLKFEEAGIIASSTDFPMAVTVGDYKFEIGNGGKVVAFDGIRLSPNTIKLLPGDSYTIQAILDDELSGEISWESSNDNIVTVDNGEIQIQTTEVTAGARAQITATCSGKSASCTVVVLQSIEGLEIPPQTISKGRSTRITLTGSYLEEVNYESLTPNIVEVNSNGTVKGLEVGTGTVQLIGKLSNKTVSVDVQVTEAITPNPPSTNPTNKPITGIPTGSTVTNVNFTSLGAQTILCGGSKKIVQIGEEIQCTSSNTDICTVESSTGIVTAGENVGTARITIEGKESGGIIAIDIKVRKSVENLSLTETSKVTVASGGKTKVHFNVSDYEPITFISSDTSLFEVSSAGKITGKEASTEPTLLVYGTLSNKSKVISVEIYTATLASNNLTYVGCYADTDGDGEADGIIFADFAHSEEGTFGGQSYSYEAKTELNTYTRSSTMYTTEEWGSAYMITPVGEQTEGQERFYIMALDTFKGNNTVYTFMEGAKQSFGTSDAFGTGKANTDLIMSKYGTASWANRTPTDLFYDQAFYESWEEGWWIPSSGELATLVTTMKSEKGFQDENGNYKILSSSSQDKSNYRRPKIWLEYDVSNILPRPIQDYNWNYVGVKYDAGYAIGKKDAGKSNTVSNSSNYINSIINNSSDWLIFDYAIGQKEGRKNHNSGQ